MSEMDEPIDVVAIIARGECLACGECVPWICPDCKEQQCSWFDPLCRHCGQLRSNGHLDRRRALADLEALQAER